MSNHTPGSRKPRLRQLIAGAITAGIALTVTASAAPAFAGIPDAGVTDYLRSPMFTSITMAANPSNPNDYGLWTYADPGDNFDGVQAKQGAPDLGATPPGPGGYIRATPSGNGYYIIQEDGTMYQYGDATAAPSNINKVSDWNIEDGDGTTNNPVTGMAITPSGQGGWVLDAQGDVYTFGDAVSHGSPGSNEYGTAVAIAATSDGGGYTILTNAGDIYDFGNAVYHGHPKFNTGGFTPRVATGLALTPNDDGYWILDNYGGVGAWGSAPFLGNNPDPNNDQAKESTDIATLPAGTGYAIVTEDGTATTYSKVSQAEATRQRPDFHRPERPVTNHPRDRATDEPHTHR